MCIIVHLDSSMKLSSSKVPHYLVLLSTLSVINHSKYLDFQNMNIHQIITIKKCCFEFLFKKIYFGYVSMFSRWGRRKKRKEQRDLICCPNENTNKQCFFKGAHLHFWAPFGAKKDDTVPRSARISSIFWCHNFDSTAITLANTASQRLQHHHQPVSEADL